MKKVIILMIMLSVSLTSCTSSDSTDINKFIERYNNISEFAIIKENFQITTESDLKCYSVITDKNVILTLKSNKSCEINECIISTSNDNYSENFSEISIATLLALTECDKQTAEQVISQSRNNNTVLKDYDIITITDNVQTSVIIRKSDKSTFAEKTLKEFLKEKS